MLTPLGMPRAALACGLRRLVTAIALVSTAILFPPHHAHVQAAPLAAWVAEAAHGIQALARSQYGMAVDAGGTIYVYGGRGPDGGELDDFWSWHSADHTWKHLVNNIVPELVEPHLAVDAAGDVYEFGGINQSVGPNLSLDGHSYGLYEYDPIHTDWTDLTPATVQPGKTWPLGREDHGFAYDPMNNALVVFGGEGPGNVTMNDMWRYSLKTHLWTRIVQNYAAPGGAQVDAREIYNISYDGHGGFYLFGGAYVFDANHQPVRWAYVNDLWRFNISTSTWTLLAGHANAYDPDMPVPRHYYGQACDPAGNFYVLGGYVSDTNSLPYFTDDLTRQYADVVIFALDSQATGDIHYSLQDFWEYSPPDRMWVDRTNRLGALANGPFIPYVMVEDPSTDELLTFGGYHYDLNQELAPSANVWTYSLKP